MKSNDRIPDTPEPHLIPSVMKVDQDTKHAICDGTNRYKCREAKEYLDKDVAVEPRLDPHLHPDVASGKFGW